MRLYDRLNIWHAAVTEISEWFLLKHLSTALRNFWPMYVGGYVRTVVWVKPGDVSVFVSSSLWFLLGWLVEF